MDYNNFLLLVSLYASIALFVALAFRLRYELGIGVLFTGVGAFQFLQTYLANTIILEITPEFVITPGTILFHATLFTVLLIYIKEDASKARTLLSAILITNLFLSAIQYFIGFSFPESPMATLFNANNVGIGIKTFSFGTILLFLDGLLIFFLYSQAAKLSKLFIVKAFMTMFLVFVFDAVIFHTVIRGVEPTLRYFNSIILRSIVSSLIYSSLFLFYLRFFEKSKYQIPSSYSLRDIFSFLLYRSTLENIQKKLAHQEKIFSDQLANAENRFQLATEIANLGYWRYDRPSMSILLNEQIVKLYKTSLSKWGGYMIPFNDFVNEFIPKDEKEVFISKVESINFDKAPSRTEIKYNVNFGDGNKGRVLTVIITDKDTFNDQVNIYGITQVIG